MGHSHSAPTTMSTQPSANSLAMSAIAIDSETTESTHRQPTDSIQSLAEDKVVRKERASIESHNGERKKEVEESYDT